MSQEQLFKPIKVGNLDLGHRLVLPPLTRRRVDRQGVLKDFSIEYYRQRAQYPGTFLIGEASAIDARASSAVAMPGLYSDAQLAKWHEVTDVVHSQKSFIFSQLWAIGHPNVDRVSADESRMYSKDEGAYLRSKTVNDLTVAEIKEYVSWYARAAHNSLDLAGFDGVEIHGANGYLIEQFIRQSSNQRTDEYGGSIENRTRFAREVLAAVVKESGGDPRRVGFRLSPWNNTGKVHPTGETVAEYAYLLSHFQDHYPDLAYISVVEPRLANGHADDAAVPSIEGLELEEWNLFMRIIWKGIIIRAGGLVEQAKQLANKDPKVLIAVGRYFISNPDLVNRLKNNLPLTKYHRPTFYAADDKGYTDYPNHGDS